MDEGERMPVRLVQENGDTISLDATSIDIHVQRQHSYFGIPLMDAKRMGIDLNQSSVTIEVQGVFTDEQGQEESAQATATLDFYQPQQVVTWGQPVSSGGGNTSSPIASAFNMAGPAGTSFAGTGISVNPGGFQSGGIGSSLGGGMTSTRDLGNDILKYWHRKYIEFPVAYWVEESGALLNPVTSGLQLWFKADAVAVPVGQSVPTWNDSSGNGRPANQADTSKQPVYRTEGANGQPYLRFDGTDDLMEVTYSPFFNSEEFTVFTVAKHSNTGDNQPILSSIEGTTGGGDAAGYALIYDADNEDAEAIWREGSTDDRLTTAGGTIKNTDAYILSYTMDDTDADSESDTAKLYLNGAEKVSQTSGVDYDPSTAADFVIGNMGSDFFQGDIYEIIVYNRVLTLAEREEVEGYLSYKYGITLPVGHTYVGTGTYSHNIKHVRVVFDTDFVASQNEPYGFLNQLRSTGMTVNVVTGNTFTVAFTEIENRPDRWFEPTESNRDMEVAFLRNGQLVTNAGGNPLKGRVLSVTSNSITIAPNLNGVSLNFGDEVYIVPVNYNDSSLIGTKGSPVVVLPLKNADTYDENAVAEKAVGPEFPDHESGATRDGNTYTRTDEYITYLLSKALTASYFDLGKEVDALGNTTMDKAFSVTIGKSANDHNCRLTIIQEYASSLGALSDTINTTLGVGQMPVTQGFSGGKTGKRVKSGGDKVQDLLGILANSNNYADNPDLNFATKILGAGVEFLNNQIKPVDHSGDYIRGIQIPYLSHATKGKNALDSHVAQRNFFLTTEGATSDKLSTVNNIHASRLFSHSAEGHRKNGISGLVTEFAVNREAEMKAYEFGLKFVAADIIL